MFAAPFVDQLGNGHVEGVYCLAKDPESLERVASGSGDGVLKVWDLPSRKEIWQTKGKSLLYPVLSNTLTSWQAHSNMVRNNLICWTRESQKLLSCSGDK